MPLGADVHFCRFSFFFFSAVDVRNIREVDLNEARRRNGDEIRNNPGTPATRDPLAGLLLLSLTVIRNLWDESSRGKFEPQSSFSASDVNFANSFRFCVRMIRESLRNRVLIIRRFFAKSR